MKKINKLALLPAFFALFVMSCGKDGATGPQGSTGAAGAAGATGAIGPAGPAGADGKDGSMIYAGTTDPAASLGAIGDYYLNKTNSLLYGPKSAGGWGAGSSLKGATGAKGANGNTVLTGTGVPDASAGVAGDFYLDKSTYNMYGPKDATGWGLATPLKGAKGATGTANVMYSGWNYAKNFRDSTIDNSAMHLADLPAPALSTDMLQNGLTMVYFTYGGGVDPLPWTTNAGGKTSQINYMPTYKRFLITRYTLDNSNSINLSTVLQYRYVIIPGGVALSAIKNNHINLNDYDAVVRFLNAQKQ